MDPNIAPQGPWYVRYGGKAIGISTGIVCLICGVTTMISLSPLCIFDGILLLVIGVIVVAMEAPLCCAMFPQLEPVNRFTARFPPLIRACCYASAAILIVSLCFGIGTVFCFLALVACAVFNGVIYWKAKKAARAGVVDLSKESGMGGGGGGGGQPGLYPVPGQPGPGYYPAGTSSAVGPPPSYTDQMMHNAAMGAMQGVTHGMMGPGGGGPGHPAAPMPQGYTGY